MHFTEKLKERKKTKKQKKLELLECSDASIKSELKDSSSLTFNNKEYKSKSSDEDKLLHQNNNISHEDLSQVNETKKNNEYFQTKKFEGTELPLRKNDTINEVYKKSQSDAFISSDSTIKQMISNDQEQFCEGSNIINEKSVTDINNNSQILKAHQISQEEKIQIHNKIIELKKLSSKNIDETISNFSDFRIYKSFKRNFHLFDKP